MKKFIYGTVTVVVLAVAGFFLFTPPAATGPAASRTVSITFRFPEGYELTEGAPFALTWEAEGPAGASLAPVKVRNFNPLISPCKLVLAPPSGSGAVILTARLYYCQKASRMCFQGDFKTRVPLVPGDTPVIPWVWEITPKKA